VKYYFNGNDEESRGKMSGRVKGTLFVDYVRMIKSRRDIDWGKYLNDEDMNFLDQPLLPSSWYPYDTFERFGLAIFHEIAGGKMEMVRLWGKMSTDLLLKIYKKMLEAGDPARSARNLSVALKVLFDFPGMELETQSPTSLLLKVRFSQNAVAAEAQAYQALGYTERLLDLAGAEQIQHTFVKRIWRGDPETLIKMNWEVGSA
jgi:hypothetical protein